MSTPSDGSSLVIDNIGSLVTNDPALGEGPLGIVENASVVIVDGVVEAVGPAGAVADERIDADGACVLPGFVDSHTHLVFAGDRAEEFTARMAGQPYDGGGIRVTTEATTRGVDRASSTALVRRRLHRGAPRRYHDHRDQVGLRPQRRRRGPIAARSPPTYTAETTFLGAHLVPAEYDGRADDYIDLVCGEMLDGRRRPRPVDRRVLRDRCVRRRPVPGRARRRAGRRARAAARTATSWATDPACSSPSSAGAPRSTTART